MTHPNAIIAQNPTDAFASQWYADAMEKLVGVVQELSLAHDLPSVMEIVRFAARDLTGADGATFVLRDGNKCFYAEENAIAPLWKGLRFPMETCISGWAMMNKQAAVIEDIFVDPRIPADAYRPTFVKSLAMVPIRTRDPVGAIGNYWATPRRPRDEEVQVLQALADTTAVAMENVHMFAQLEQRARDMAVLTQAAPVAIVSLDQDAKVLSWNPAADKVFGVNAEQSLGAPLGGIESASAEAFSTLLDVIRSGGTVDSEMLQGHRADGTKIDLRISGGPVNNEDGTLRAILLTIQDETERNQLERQFLHAQKMEAVGQLTGGIAHDFNNLLGVLIGNMDLARERVKHDPDTLAMLNRAIDAGLRGAELNKRLLAFSRRQALQPEEVDVNASMTTMVELLKRSLGERVEISLHCAPDVWPVRIDPVQLETAIVNLSVNARDAMPSGGMLTIETSNTHLDDDYAAKHEALKAGDYVMVAVSDTGAGMPPEVLNRAFDPFFTTKPVGKGTGLGLSMIYGFMKQSEGHVNLYSEQGVGTTVRLYLPRAGGAGRAKETVNIAANAITKGSGLVLVVEDNPDMRAIAVQLLTGLGYSVEEAENADAAIALLEQGLKPALLFTDVIMPGRMDGIDLAELAQSRLPGLPVLLTSGFTERATEARENDGKPFAFPLINKPYRKDTLAVAIQDALARCKPA
ncbi:MAG: ATP-binding protein [Rhodospirillales bacterium]|nr:ATP-binding protein [Rhodospirillales bacterium]